MSCFLAEYGIYERGPMTPCEGRLVRCHLISQQVLRREVWPRRDTLRQHMAAYGAVLPRALRDLIWDERVWVWGCGGIAGCDGHHGLFDRSRTLRIPREAIPEDTERIAFELGLLWYLDREYGELKAVAA